MRRIYFAMKLGVGLKVHIPSSLTIPPTHSNLNGGQGRLPSGLDLPHLNQVPRGRDRTEIGSYPSKLDGDGVQAGGSKASILAQNLRGRERKPRFQEASCFHSARSLACA